MPTDACSQKELQHERKGMMYGIVKGLPLSLTPPPKSLGGVLLGSQESQEEGNQESGCEMHLAGQDGLSVGLKDTEKREEEFGGFQSPQHPVRVDRGEGTLRLSSRNRAAFLHDWRGGLGPGRWPLAEVD